MCVNYWKLWSLWFFILHDYLPIKYLKINTNSQRFQFTDNLWKDCIKASGVAICITHIFNEHSLWYCKCMINTNTYSACLYAFGSIWAGMYVPLQHKVAISRSGEIRALFIDYTAFGSKKVQTEIEYTVQKMDTTCQNNTKHKKGHIFKAITPNWKTNRSLIF